MVYVNDNFGRWQSGFEQTVEHCPGAGGARAGVCEATGSGEVRLFCAEAEAFRFLSDAAGNSAEVPGYEARPFNWPVYEQLRPVYGERCVHAGFSDRRSRGLRRGSQQGGAL